jgi:hypothetical protein
MNEIEKMKVILNEKDNEIEKYKIIQKNLFIF